MSRGKRERLPEVLFEIGKAVGSSEDLGGLLNHISELTCELVGADACSIMLLDGSRERLLAKASYGLRSSALNRVSFKVGEGVAGWVAANGEALIVNDVTAEPRFIRRDHESNTIKSIASVPLLARGSGVGVLNATCNVTNCFSDDDIELLRFVAKTIALDIENRRLQRMAVTDPLTGSYNREFLQQRLPIEVETSGKSGNKLSVAMVDVDHFKAINDGYGHDAGDRVLVEVADRLRRTIRTGDTLVRYGGEEFLVVLPNADRNEAREIGERMRQRLQKDPIVLDGETIEVRISVGVAEFTGESESATGLVRRADTALYNAKGRGRNRVEVAL